ncbi:MAG: hypothetical protein WCP93_04070 [Candidatus Berkelbacteria bacterium]
MPNTTAPNLVTIVGEARNCNGTKPPIQEFINFLQGPLEDLCIEIHEVLSTQPRPLRVKLKVVGPPIYSKREFSGICIIGKDCFDRKTVEVRIRQRDTLLNWKCFLILSDEKTADVILGLSRVHVTRFLKHGENEAILFEQSLSSKSRDTINSLKSKTLNQVKICESLTKKIMDPANLREFCYKLVLPKDRQPEKPRMFSETELFLAIKAYSTENYSPKVMRAVLCNLIIKGLFDPIPDRPDDYQNVHFMPSMIFYEAADSYLDELEKEKIAKREQRKSILEANLSRAQGELERLKDQLAQKEQDVQRIQNEIEQFDLEN